MFADLAGQCGMGNKLDFQHIGVIPKVHRGAAGDWSDVFENHRKTVPGSVVTVVMNCVLMYLPDALLAEE